MATLNNLPTSPDAVPALTANSEPNALNLTQVELRRWFEQAHASSRIEGHIPDPQYLADCEAVIAGTMTMDELRAASRARAESSDKDR